MISLPWTILWLATGISVAVCGLLIYSLLRVRRNAASKAEPEQSFPSSPILEFIWTFIPVGLLLIILALTFQAMTEIKP